MCHCHSNDNEDHEGVKGSLPELSAVLELVEELFLYSGPEWESTKSEGSYICS